NQVAQMEQKGEPLVEFPLMPAENEKEPKEEPLELVLFENEIPQKNFIGEKDCKKEEIREDEMSSASHFDVSAFSLPNDNIPVPSFPLEAKEENIDGQNMIEGEASAKKARLASMKKSERATPQCIMCEAYPKTASGYASHLYIHHKSSLKVNGVYLRCDCGTDVHNYDYNPNHAKECDRLKFTLRKLHFTKMGYTTPQCFACETYPSTASGYVSHLYSRHNTTLKLNGWSLICSCGKDFRTRGIDPNHTQKCDGLQFSLKNYEETTPQCIMCQVYPKTATAYASHLYYQHKSTMRKSGIYLKCACGADVYNSDYNPNHINECDGRQFTLQKLEVKILTTPQCILCETFPTSAAGYVRHLKVRHDKSTLNSNGIFLRCSCGIEFRTTNMSLKHIKECDRKQFTLHKLDEQ
ncbi:hypothetical protein PENTCL1PPCAC_12950, partial [Pristionchus entomophagus]